MAEAANAASLAKGVCKRPTQTDPDVLNGMVIVNVQVTIGLYSYVKSPVAGQAIDHVVQEPNPG
jgi:hypothetical protein